MKTNTRTAGQPVHCPPSKTVALTPIKQEVADYVAWLEREGYQVIKTSWPRLPGQNAHVTFLTDKTN